MNREKKEISTEVTINKREDEGKGCQVTLQLTYDLAETTEQVGLSPEGNNRGELWFCLSKEEKKKEIHSR